MVRSGAFLVVVAIVLVALATNPYWDHRNRGEATPCPNFLRMSHAQQVRVIEKAFTPQYRSVDYLDYRVQETIDGCRTQPSDTTVGIVNGP